MTSGVTSAAIQMHSAFRFERRRASFFTEAVSRFNTYKGKMGATANRQPRAGVGRSGATQVAPESGVHLGCARQPARSPYAGG
jgi:hypothetical protein